MSNKSVAVIFGFAWVIWIGTLFILNIEMWFDFIAIRQHSIRIESFIQIMAGQFIQRDLKLKYAVR